MMLETSPSKICIKCKVSKPLSQYYKRAEMEDGHRNTCKSCSNAGERKRRVRVVKKETKWNSNYRRARAYAWVITRGGTDYIDTVHEAWLRNFKYEGTNLFDQDIFLILKCVRNVWFGKIRDGKYMKNGVCYKRQFYDVDDLHLKSSFASPDTQLISKEFYEDLFKKVDSYSSGHHSTIDVGVLRRVVDYFDQGYGLVEIGKEMGMSTQRIHYYRNKLKKIITQMQTHNPFNGSRIKISKKITRRTFESHPEKYGEYVYDVEKDCDCNEAYEIRINPVGEYLLIKEKND